MPLLSVCLLSLDGEVGPQAQKVQGFARALERAVGVPVVFWDESLSSVEADELMIAQGVSRAKRRAQIDQMAAALILESYLAHRRQTGAPRDALSLSETLCRHPSPAMRRRRHRARAPAAPPG